MLYIRQYSEFLNLLIIEYFCNRQQTSIASCMGLFNILRELNTSQITIDFDVRFKRKISVKKVTRRFDDSMSMVGHLFQNYDTIYVRFFPTYTCNHSCYTIYVRFFATHPYVLSYKRAYICAQKSPYIHVYLTNKHVVYGVTESRRIRGTELYRQQKLLHVR